MDNIQNNQVEVPPILVTKDVAFAMMKDNTIVFGDVSNPFDAMLKGTMLGEQIMQLPEKEFLTFSAAFLLAYGAISSRIEAIDEQRRKDGQHDD